MKIISEYELRIDAIKRFKRGEKVSRICRELGRSREWFYKWLSRYIKQGEEGLKDEPRTPHHIIRVTDPEVIGDVIRVRKQLVRKPWSDIGAHSIMWELEQIGYKPEEIPCVSTINNILSKHGLIKRCEGRRRRGKGPPFPKIIIVRGVGDIHETDIIGKRYIRGIHGLETFYSYHTIDIFSKGIYLEQHHNKSSESMCRYQLRCWKTLGIPKAWQVDNAMGILGSPRYPEGFTQPLRLALMMRVHVVFIPQKEPYRNGHIESFNRLYQEKLLWNIRHKSLRAFLLKSKEFVEYYMHRRPNSSLRIKKHGSRFPAQVIAKGLKRLRFPPEVFNLNHYRDEHGILYLPLCSGKISFVRKVSERGEIDIQGRRFRLPKEVVREYVVATLSILKRRLTVRRDKEIIATFRFPIPEKVTQPLVKVRR